ncbi:hypothetical protein FRC03_008601 [Tulasnella sp. 419]|nr:hypothetical protein FRC02_009999 [Tulasnella sp. 418]KAG8970404.1 hypothetical protein FRC03_008601 [Tulasnella sp. 419]
MLQITWMIQPTATLIAQKFIPLELWVPYFNLIGFSLGTFANTQIKKRQVAAAKRGKDNQKPDRKEL